MNDGTDSSNHPFDDLCRDLLKSKLGDLFSWTVPNIKKTVGPFDLTPFEAYEVECKKIANACADHLAEYTQAQLQELAGPSVALKGSLRREWQQFRESEIRTLWNRVPKWYAGGFGHPGHMADFQTWCRMEQFGLSEILCLSIGIDPVEFSEQYLENLKKEGSSKLAPPLNFLLMRYEQFRRRFVFGRFGATIQPDEFLAWVGKVDLEVHSEFLGLLKRFHDGPTTGQPSSPPPPTAQPTGIPALRPDGREIASVAKLILVIAMDEYGYRPRSPRSPVPKEISDIAAQHGISITPETVRKFLLLGSKYISDVDQDD